jgi:mono/diheme cytochrome c family protein
MGQRWRRVVPGARFVRAAAVGCVSGLAVVAASTGTPEAGAPAQLAARPAAVPAAPRAILAQYCVTCHNDRLKTAGLTLAPLDADRVGEHAETWEKVVRKLRVRMMPPPGAPRPDEPAFDALVTHLETALDRAAAAAPNPGRTETFHRLNRTEYRNAIRDLLGLDVDVAALLPRDDASFGFDNVGVGELSPTLLERYLAAAQKVSRLAVGSPLLSPASQVVLLPPDLTQEDHVEGLPFGTRGGAAIRHVFPVDGSYELQIRLSRDRNENVEGLYEPHTLELTLDGQRLELFNVVPNRYKVGDYYSDEAVDRDLRVRATVGAGPHEIGATFERKTFALLETVRQPYAAHFNMDRHPRVQPAVRSVSITGPFDARGAGDTPSRRRILVCRPSTAADEPACARTILTTLARRAYRRAVGEADLEVPLGLYRDVRATDGFEAGVEMGLRAILASTEFLFRVERDPGGVAPGAAYRVSDVELASRLSFFLWSSIPDEELLATAIGGTLRRPDVLERQVRRMVADPRAEALIANFAGQWLYLRNLDAVSPDPRTFPEFDDNLRQAFRRETELLFESVVNEDRSVLDLLRAPYTFVNERLARHYGIPNVYGSRFRRVVLPENSVRAGLLGHGSILTVTSYANRTSPVLRGKWVLENVLGTPPPPPPPNVPPLGSTPVGKALSMRERMAQHRSNAACAGCHQLMDPAGLSMENFDAIGRWRTRTEGGAPVDAAGGLPGGVTFDGVAGLRAAILSRPELFATTVTEKLLTYALGRGLDHHDAPAVRAIAREARSRDYRFSSLVLGVVTSAPFQMRMAAR